MTTSVLQAEAELCAVAQMVEAEAVLVMFATASTIDLRYASVKLSLR